MISSVLCSTTDILKVTEVTTYIRCLFGTFSSSRQVSLWKDWRCGRERERERERLSAYKSNSDVNRDILLYGEAWLPNKFQSYNWIRSRLDLWQKDNKLARVAGDIDWNLKSLCISDFVSFHTFIRTDMLHFLLFFWNRRLTEVCQDVVSETNLRIKYKTSDSQLVPISIDSPRSFLCRCRTFH